MIVYTHGTKVFLPNKVNFFTRLAYKLKSDIICFAYRDFSHSDPGYPSETALIRDCQTISNFTIDYVNSQPEQIDVILFGKSFGGCTALKLAQFLPKDFPKALILESAFTNIKDVIRFIIPTCGLGKLISKITSMRWPND